MVGTVLMITMFLTLIFAAIAWAIARQKISPTTGRLTNSLLGRCLAWGYPLLLAAALVAYYALPTENLYHAEMVSPYAPYFDETMNNAVQALLDVDDPALLASTEVPLEQATLPFTGASLDVRIPFSNNVLVSQTPSEDGTLILYYFPGKLNISGFAADDLIQPKLNDFVLDGQGRLTVRGLDTDVIDAPNINVILWSTPGLMTQFPVSAPPVYRRFSTCINSAVILQVPADTTVTYYGDPLIKGQRL